MPHFMAAWTWQGPDSPEIDDLIAKERQVLEQWRSEGVLTGRWIAKDECSGWLLIRAADAPAAQTRLASLPLARWLEFTISELA